MTKPDSFESDSTMSSGKNPNDFHSLDAAIEYCVEKLESNRELDPKELIARFPSWTKELAEFIDNWSGMEQFASALAGPNNDLPDISAEGKKQFGDYELIEKIGAGGMGVIYKARQISLDRIVAIKMVSREHRDRDRFRIEAEAAAGLTHPNIVPIYEIGETNERMFFSMRLIEGGDLRDCVCDGPVPPRDAARIAETIARAVSYAHQRGILHRDLKPANVLMDVDKQPHITDFGLAKQISRDTEITRTGTIMGTPGYMAPEQATGKVKGLTVATDVYGVGAILYALLTGDAPFTGESSLEIIRRVVDETPVSPRIKQPELARDIETICLKCLAKEPEARYVSAEQLADDLARFLKNQPVKARPVTSTERVWRWCRRNPAIALLSGAVVLLLFTTTMSSLFLAFSERNARLQAEANSLREINLRQEADTARNHQVQSVKDAKRAQAELCLTNGFWQSKQDNHGEAVLWFSEAAKLSKDDPKKILANQLRFQSWFDRQPVPVAAMFLEDEYRDMANHRKQGMIQFRWQSTELLCQAGSHFVVWDHQTDERWNLHEAFPEMSVASWNSDGSLLAIGQEGKVKVLGGDSREMEIEFETDGSVAQLAFAFDSRFLAAATNDKIKVWDLRTEQAFEADLEFDNRIVWISFSDKTHQLVAVVEGGKSKLVGTAYGYRLADESVDLKYEVVCRADRTTEGRNAYRPKFVADDRFLVVRSNEERPEHLNWIDTDSGEITRTVPLNTHKFSIDVSNDGQRLITGDEKNAIVRWYFDDPKSDSSTDKADTSLDNVRTNREKAGERSSTIIHDDRVSAVDFNSDLLIATGGWDFTVQLSAFEDYLSATSSEQRLRRLVTLVHQKRIQFVKFSPDGSQLVTAQVDGLIRVWQLPKEPLMKESVPVPPSGSLAKIVDDQHWMTAGMPRWSGAMSNISVIDTETGQIVGGTNNLTQESSGWIIDSCCLPSENLIVTLHSHPSRSRRTYSTEDGSAGSIRFWNLAGGQLLRDPIPLDSEPRWIASRSSEDKLAICLANMSVVIVDPQSMEIEDTLLPTTDTDEVKTSNAPHDSEPFMPKGSLGPTHRCNQQVVFSPDGKLVAAWSAKQVGLWVWEVDTRQLCFCCVDVDGQPFNRIEFSPDGRRIVVAGGRNNFAKILDSKTGAAVVPDLKLASVVYHARFNSDGTKVVVACRDGFARVFDAATGELILSNMSHESDVVDATMTPDGKFILSLGFDHLRVWHSDDGSLAIKPISTPNRSRQLHVTPDSKYVIVAGGQNEVSVFDLSKSLKLVHKDITDMILSSELLSSKTISEGTLIDLTTPQWLQRWAEHQGKTDSTWTRAE